MNIRRLTLNFSIPLLVLVLFFVPHTVLADEACELRAVDTPSECNDDALQIYNDCLDAGTAVTTCDAEYATKTSICSTSYFSNVAACEAEDTAEAAATAATTSTGVLVTATPDSTYQSIMEQGIIFSGICSSRTADCPCRDTGDCSLEDIMQVVVNISVFLLGLIGSVVLLMFMYGGFLWLTSQGKPDQVKKGKDTMVNAVIGLTIVFGAYAAISIVISVIKTGDIPEGTNVEDILEANPEGGTGGIDGAGDLINTSNE